MKIFTEQDRIDLAETRKAASVLINRVAKLEQLQKEVAYPFRDEVGLIIGTNAGLTKSATDDVFAVLAQHWHRIVEAMDKYNQVMK